MSLHRPIPRMEPDPKLLAFVTEHPDIPTVVRQRAAFFVFFTQTIYPLLEEQRPILDRLYCATNGRPAVDPVGLLGALLLQFVERLPDRQAAETVGFDLRWRLALHLQEDEGQPAGAVHNPHEPEAQWSSKSTTRDKTWIGYKAQVAETVQAEPCLPGEPTPNVITAVVTQKATASDQPGMAQVIHEQAEQGLEPPEVLYVDGAYVYAEALHEAQTQGRELRGPARSSPKVGRLLPADRFDVPVENRYAVCPAGQTSTPCSRVEEDKAGKTIYRLEWNKALCQACALRDQCLGARQTHRTIEVGQWHTGLQDRRREMQTKAFKQDLHHRNGIEGPQSELVRAYGLRWARYRGLAKVRLQNYFIGAACNVRRWFRRLAWEVAQGLRPRGTIAVLVTV